MKLSHKILTLTLLLFSIVSTCLYAAEIQTTSGPERKLQRGFVNIVLSPIEISHELGKVKRTDSFLPSWVGGLGRGSYYMVGRILSGAYDLITAPISLPAGYEPLVYPEFVWEHLDDPAAK